MKPLTTINLLDDTLSIQGEVNYRSAAQLMKQLDKLVLSDSLQLDCGGITHADSVAVSLLLYLLKERSIVLLRVGDSLQGLLNLYGVTSFFSYAQD